MINILGKKSLSYKVQRDIRDQEVEAPDAVLEADSETERRGRRLHAVHHLASVTHVPLHPPEIAG